MKYNTKRLNDFAAEFGDDPGFREEYGGRGSYRGPALDIDREEEQATIRRFPYDLRIDNMGKGLIVYPAD